MTEQDERAAFADIRTGYYPIITAIFAAVLIISNVCAAKWVVFFPGEQFAIGPVQILPLNTDGAFFLFPLAYILGDVLTEVYGFKAARRAIFVGFGALLLGSFCFWVAVELPYSDPARQENFSSVIGVVPRLVFAGVAAYMVGQLLNSKVLVLIKEKTKEKHLWARLLGSTVVGEFADTLIFCSIAAGAIGITRWQDFVNYLIFGWIWKTLIEVLVLPFTYRIIAFIKKREPTYASAPTIPA